MNVLAKDRSEKLKLQVSLALTLVKREVQRRYRGSMLGIFWSLLTPLFMLAVYTFVFGVVLKARWSVDPSDQGSMGQFAVVLFSGLVIFQLFSEVIVTASTLISANANLVKKTVFPLHILVPVTLGAAIFHFVVSLAILSVFVVLVMGSLPITILLLPLVMLPFCIMTLGLGWIIASLGVFFRDIAQILGTVMTALLFLSPVFFPLERLPEGFRSLISFNPIAIPVQQLRSVMIWGEFPEFAPFAIYSVVALIVGTLGYWWFNRTSNGFADVL